MNLLAVLSAAFRAALLVDYRPGTLSCEDMKAKPSAKAKIKCFAG
jgi:hypothetical protein